MRSALPLLVFVLLASPQGGAAPPGPPPLDLEVLKTMDAAIAGSIRRKKLPGGVLWVERRGQIYRKAFGKRSTHPKHEPMTLDTIFDAASLTKVMATTPSVMKLIESGQIGLEDKITRYLPELRHDPGKQAVTIRHLLTHTSGLLPGIRRGYRWSGYRNGIALACGEPPGGPTGRSYAYSDLNFILLGEIVQRVGKQPLETFAATRIFAPLKMTGTGYRPAPGLAGRIAPTTRLADGSILRGVVHDPTCRAMGGVAGHAGLFTTAHDVARYARMLLHGGQLDGVRLLREETVKLMTTVQSPPLITARRGLGFDIDSPYAGPRGTRFPIGSFGHTGWTGTSLWIDPFSETIVIFLSNRNHPGGGNVVSLRHRLGTLAAEAVTGFDFDHLPGALAELTEADRKAAAKQLSRPRGEVRNGIDVLEEEEFSKLQGLKIGLITNHTGRNRHGRSTIDLLHRSKAVELVALFGPEHGIRGTREGVVKDGVDAKTGLPVHSLYAGPDRRKPQARHLQGLDALVFDMQDIGCRFFTYISTMGLGMEAAEEARDRLRGPRPGQSHRGHRSGRAALDGGERLRGVSRHPGAPRHDGGRAGPALSRRALPAARPPSHPAPELATGYVLRPDRAAVDQALPQHAVPLRRPPLPRSGAPGIHQPLGGTGHPASL